MNTLKMRNLGSPKADGAGHGLAAPSHIRAPILIATSLSCFVGAVALMIIHLLAHPKNLAPLTTGIIGACSFGLTPLIYRKTGSVDIAGGVFVTCLCVSLLAALLAVGGLSAQLAPSVITLPVIAAFFLKRTHAITVTVVTAATVALYWLLEEARLVDHSAVVPGLEGIRVQAAVYILLICISATIAIASSTLFWRTYGDAVAATEDARRASEAKSSFLANMSHEIRTPLNGVMGLVGALARTETDPDRQATLAVIQTSARQLNVLLGDILDLSRLESCGPELVSEPVSPVELMHQVLSLFAARAAEKGLGLEAAMDAPSGLVILGDEARLSQILNNLLGNAVKFCEAGEIAVTLRARRLADGGWRVSYAVSDTGPGLAPELLERLFERFEQGDQSLARRFGGSGLGLAISNRLARAMGGALTVSSRQGQGSVFTFSADFPEAPPARSSPHSAPSTGPTPLRSDRPVQVLVVDDHQTNRLVVRAILGDLVHLEEAESGPEAIAAAEARKYDLILMDMQMPGMSGLEAISTIRQRERADNCPASRIVMLTAHVLPEHEAQALAAGADRHIAKPVSAETLLGLIESLIDQAA